MGEQCAKLGGIDELKKDVADLKTAVELLRTVTGKLEEGSKMFEGTMNDLQGHKKAVEEKISGVTQQVTQITGAADSVKSKITNVEQTIADIRKTAGF